MLLNNTVLHYLTLKVCVTSDIKNGTVDKAKRKKCITVL